MKILTALFGGSVGVGRLRIRKWMIYPLSIVAVMLALFVAILIDMHSAGFAADTLGLADMASDVGDTAGAKRLYAEACDEGNEDACVIVRSQKAAERRSR